VVVCQSKKSSVTWSVNFPGNQSFDDPVKYVPVDAKASKHQEGKQKA